MTAGVNEKPINIMLYTKTQFGVLGNGLLANILKEKFAIFRDIEYPDYKKDYYKIWIEKIIRPKFILKKINANNASANANSSSSSNSANGLNGNSAGSNSSDLDRQGGQGTDSGKDNENTAWTNLFMKNSGNEDILAALATNKEASGATASSSSSSSAAGKKGNPLDPSIIFATIGNADEGLVCMDINNSVTQVATGYLDSIVRVWRLDPSSDETTLDNPPFFGRSLSKYNNGSNNTFELEEILPKTKDQLLNQHVNKRMKREQGSENDRYPMIELKGHTGPIYSLSQNSNDRLLISSSSDESIRLWDLSVLQTVGKYHTNSIAWDSQFNTDLDYYFATANQDTTVTVYATDRTNPLRMMTGHISDVNCVTWHPNNTLLASGSDDRTIRIWDLKGESRRLLKGSNSPITSLAISSIGTILAAGNELGKIYLYDMRSSRILSVLQGHDSSPIYSLAFSQDNQCLVSGSGDCSVRIWDLVPAYDTSFTTAPAYQLNSFHVKPMALSTSIGSNTASSSSGIGGSSSGSGIGGSSSLSGSSNTANAHKVFTNYITKVMKPKHTFFTKSTPVYKVGYHSSNMIYAGGPVSFAAATSK